jgi:hypothetical protein
MFSPQIIFFKNDLTLKKKRKKKEAFSKYKTSKMVALYIAQFKKKL